MDEREQQMFREHELRTMQRENLKTDNGEMMQPKGGSDNSRVNVNDSLALVAIYNATDGPNWNSKTNWLTGPVNSWFGITVSNGFVTGVTLENNNLRDTIPTEIGNLTNLQYLNLNENELYCSIPPEIGNLINLLEININENNLLGIIPAEIGNLSNLKKIYLDQNRLSGGIPPEIGNLINLLELDLYDNLIGGIPPEIGNLINLRRLSLAENKLSENIPPEIGNLINLQELNLRFNSLTGSIPVEIGNLINLQELNLSYNTINGVIPAEIGNLSNLLYMEFQESRLTGCIPPEIGNLTNLKALYLSWNEINGIIPAEIGAATNLQDIRLEGNLLIGSIPLEICNLSNLNNFAFEWNNFNLGSCPAIDCLKNKGVNMHYENQLNGLNLLADCDLVASVEIGQDNDSVCADGASYFFVNDTANNYATIQWFTTNGGGYFENETSLHPIYHPGPANDYPLGSIIIGVQVNGDFGFAEDYMNLYFLSPPQASAGEDANVDAGNSYYLINANALFYNKIAWTTSGDGTFNNPAEQNPVYTPGNADISNGQVQLCLNVFSNICPPASSCMNLHIQQIQNNSDSLALVALYNATNGSNWTNKTNWLTGPLNTWYGITVTESFVTKIVLYNNNLIGFFPPEIWNLTNLVTLSLGENYISGNIPTEIGNLTNLQELVIWGNQLTGSIPIEIGNLIQLQMIQLSANQLSGSIPTSIGNLINLLFLHLTNNQLTGDIPAEIGNLSNLQQLHLYGNQLSGISAEIGNLTNLQWINLSNNQLAGNIPSTIGNLFSLQSVDISNNLLSGSIPIEICNIPNLGTFTFYNNYLDFGSCPAITCLINKGLYISNGTQLNGNDLRSACGAMFPFIEIGINADSICADGSGYYFGDVTARNYLFIQWSTLNGTGYFEYQNSQKDPIYVPGSMDYLQDSITIVATANGDMGFATDYMVLYFVNPPTAFAGSDTIINHGGHYFLQNASAESYSSLTWTSSGDGTFYNESLVTTSYYPGPNDLEKQCVNLVLTAFPNNPCALSAKDTLRLCFLKQVSNVVATQRTDGSQIVDVFYDLSSPQANSNILAEVSFDGAVNFQTLDSVTGDVGATIPSGENKHIIWKAGREIPDTTSDSAIFRITANPGQWQCGDTLLDPRDSSVYTTVQIGMQCWMKENLNIGIRINSFEAQSDNGFIEKYCYYNDATNCDIYGGLYRWDEIMNYTGSSNFIPSGRQGICPAGWHVPSDGEWCQLETYIDATVNCTDIGERGTDAGGKMKEEGTFHWLNPNTGATNSSGFTALPAGRIYSWGMFDNLNFFASFWSSYENSATEAWDRDISSGSARSFREINDKTLGLSARCLNDD